MARRAKTGIDNRSQQSTEDPANATQQADQPPSINADGQAIVKPKLLSDGARDIQREAQRDAGKGGDLNPLPAGDAESLNVEYASTTENPIAQGQAAWEGEFVEDDL